MQPRSEKYAICKQQKNSKTDIRSHRLSVADLKTCEANPDYLLLLKSI